MAVPAFHHSFLAMNTRLSLVLPATGTRAGQAVAEAIRRYVDQQETLMSRFRDGPLARLNARAASEATPVPKPLWDIVTECRRHRDLTDGAFDIAQGVPKGIDHVAFDDRARTVRFTDPALYFDLGAIGKGIALQGVDAVLRRNVVTQAFVSFGESSLLALGEHPAGGGWAVGLAAGQAVGTDTGFTLMDEAMSVSGQTASHRHIVDPRTGAWVAPRTAAVAGPCPIAAEVLSTALCVAEPERHHVILARYPQMRAFVSTRVNRGDPAYA